MSETTPPDLPGYDFEVNLGRGGFADVYRYRQHRPARQVAVKVLRKTDLTEHEQRQFENEIDRMSMLSQHPGILTVYEADVTPDGRPYFSMEYCPDDHFGEIARAEPLSAVRALEVGVKVAGAVEAAHQAGILHRDIKPANILLTAYGQPALTDFGIAGGRDAEADSTDSAGVTIPFAAPEVLSRRTLGDERSDVYSLGATVYALVAGRAPFSTGQPMRQSEMIAAILNGSPQPIGRSDVPREFENVILTALAKQPESRFSSAASFGRALQTVETALGYPQTHLQLAPATGSPTRRRTSRDHDDDSSTVVNAPSRVDPSQRGRSQLRSDAPIERVPDVLPPSDPAQHKRSDPDLPVPEDLELDTVLPDKPSEEPKAPTIEEGPPPRPGPPVALLASVAAAVVLVLLVGLVVVFAQGDDSGDDAATTTTADPDAFSIATPPPTPVGVEVTIDGQQALVTWEAPDAKEDDAYRITVSSRANPSQEPTTTDLEQRIDLERGEREICVQLIAIRGGQVSTRTQEVCSA